MVNDAATLTTGITVDSTSGIAGAFASNGGDVTFASTVNGAFDLNIDADGTATDGNVTISGAVGAGWTAAAITVALVTQLWLASGVEFSFA